MVVVHAVAVAAAAAAAAAVKQPAAVAVGPPPPLHEVWRKRFPGGVVSVAVAGGARSETTTSRSGSNASSNAPPETPTTFVLARGARGEDGERERPSVTAVGPQGRVLWTATGVCVSDDFATDPRSQAVMHVGTCGDKCVVVVVGQGSGPTGSCSVLQGFSCATGEVLYNRSGLVNTYGGQRGAFDPDRNVLYTITRPPPDFQYRVSRVAFDVVANRVLWNVTSPSASVMTPVLGNPDVVAFVGRTQDAPQVIFARAATGAQVAAVPIPAPASSGRSVSFVCGGDTLVLSFASNELWTMDMATGAVLWKSGAPSADPMRRSLFPASQPASDRFVVARRDGTEAYPCRWPRGPAGNASSAAWAGKNASAYDAAGAAAAWPAPLWRSKRSNASDLFDSWANPVVLPFDAQHDAQQRRGVVQPLPPSPPAGASGPAARPGGAGVVLTQMNDNNVTVLDLETGAERFEFLMQRRRGLSAGNVRLARDGAGRRVLEGFSNNWTNPGSGVKNASAAAWDAETGRVLGVAAGVEDGMYSTGVWGAGGGAAVYMAGDTVLLAELPT